SLFFVSCSSSSGLCPLSLHDALPIWAPGGVVALVAALNDAGIPPGTVEVVLGGRVVGTALADEPRVAALSFTGSNAVGEALRARDRKSTRLNSSHVKISYAVFCLKKK